MVVVDSVLVSPIFLTAVSGLDAADLRWEDEVGITAVGAGIKVDFPYSSTI